MKRRRIGEIEIGPRNVKQQKRSSSGLLYEWLELQAERSSQKRELGASRGKLAAVKMRRNGQGLWLIPL